MSKPITLVFTDMVGSSAAKRADTLGSSANERDRAYLESIQAKHLRLIRSAIDEYSGTEIMTIGDSFFLTFEDPVDAVRCAAAIQQRLVAQPIDTPSGPMRLRIGIHIGTPEFFENSWHGTDVDTAARAESAGSPGQIVATDTARQAIGDVIGIQFRPIGTFALKGVGDVKLWDTDYDRHGLRRPSLKSNEEKRRVRVLSTSVAAVLVGAALVAGGLYWWNQHKQAAAAALAAASTSAPVAKDSIILADFENKTGDPVFDTTLTQAFAIQMQQSPVLNLVSQQHLRQSMKYLGKSSDDPLTADIAREVGQREGVKAYLTGTIAKFGTSYVVTVSAQNTNTGDDIASEQAQSPDKEHVLSALGTVASAMRARLGESLSSIQSLDTPLGQATTPSLEAFRAYALGDVDHEKGLDLPEAEGHYRHAVEIDPNFAMAWARLGVVYSNSGQRGKALECYNKAYTLSKHVSERERLYIQGHFYMNDTGDIPKAIDTMELATQTYPLNFDNYVNLAVALENEGKFEESLIPLKKAASISPDDAIAQLDIYSTDVALDRFQEASTVRDAANRLGIGNGTTIVTENYTLDFLTGDAAGMAREQARVEGRPDEYQFTNTLAFIQEFGGRYSEAQQTWQRAADQAAAQKAPDAQAGLLLGLLSGRAMAGMCGDTDHDVKAALALDKSKATLIAAAFTASLCGDAKTTLPLLAALSKTYPEDTVVTQITLPQSRAALALAAGHYDEAARELQDARPYDLIAPGAYLQGLAYLALKDGPNAVDAFQRATKYRGAALQGFQNYPQAQLGLARAYSMTGDKASAKKAYEALFATWKNADQNLPQLLAAKKEYAALR